jgi:hypothetical protein
MVTVFVPDDAVAAVADAQFIFQGRKTDGEFCAGTVTGKGQGFVVLYPTAQRAAAVTQAITGSGENPGKRIADPSRVSLRCTDSEHGAIGEYSGTVS